MVPSEQATNAIRTLKTVFDIDASGHVPRGLEQVDFSVFNLIVAIDDPRSGRNYETLKQRGVPKEILLRWKIEDPYGDDQDSYDSCALALTREVSKLSVAPSLN